VNDEPQLDEPLVLAIPGAHRDPAAIEVPDVPAALRIRTLPRHRARRSRWKPGSESVESQHAYDRDALVG
jgi:hypothetical protein